MLWPGINTPPSFSQLLPAVSSSPWRKCWSLRKAMPTLCDHKPRRDSTSQLWLWA